MKSKVSYTVIAGMLVALSISFAYGISGRYVGAKHISYLESDYPVYADALDIANSADLVVRGTVQEVLPSARLIPEGVDLKKLPAEKAANFGILTTDVVFKIDQVLAASKDVGSTTITVSHLGGEDAQKKSVAEAEPLSERGRSYVLFLKQMQDGKYAALGGPQGRFLIENGKLTLISEHAEEHPVGKELKDTNVDALAKKIKDGVKK